MKLLLNLIHTWLCLEEVFDVVLNVYSLCDFPHFRDELVALPSWNKCWQNGDAIIFKFLTNFIQVLHILTVLKLQKRKKLLIWFIYFNVCCIWFDFKDIGLVFHLRFFINIWSSIMVLTDSLSSQMRNDGFGTDVYRQNRTCLLVSLYSLYRVIQGNIFNSNQSE